jgi:hypothetical protein
MKTKKLKAYKVLRPDWTCNPDPIVNLLANTLFYIPIGGILLTTFIAVRG